MSEELRKTFHEELDSIKNGIVRMAGRVSEAIVRGTEVFLAGDMAAAETLISNDDVIDATNNRRMSGSEKWCTQLDITSKTETNNVSACAEPCAHIDTKTMIWMQHRSAGHQNP